MNHSHKTHAELQKCALNFGGCYKKAKGRRDKQSNKPNGSHPEDIKTNY